MTLIVPYFAQAQTAAIVIDGITYRVPLIDAAGHLQVDVVTSTLPALAATSAKQDTMITALQLIDDLRGALAAVAADRLNVNAFATGASEVKSLWVATTDPSTTRKTVITPTSGKKIRMVSVQMVSHTVTAAYYEVYFGTGTDITTTPAKAVVHAYLDRDTVPTGVVSWPDGGGPVGDADEVLSIFVVPNVATDGFFLFQYREE